MIGGRRGTDSTIAVNRDPRAQETVFTPPRYHRPFGIGRELALQYAVLAVVALLVLAPIIPTLIQAVVDRPLYESGGLFTLQGYVRLFTQAAFGTVVLNTFIFAALTTIFSLLIAIPVAIVITRTRLPGSRFFAFTMQWPFFISSLLLGFGWMIMYGPSGFVSIWVRGLVGEVPWSLYTLPGMAITEAVASAPIVYMFCVNTLRQSDSSLESAARVCGSGPFRIIFKVILPMMRPPIVYSSILVFSMAVETLSVPLLFGQPVGITVFSTFLYKHGLQSVNPDYTMMGAASTIIVLVAIGLVIIQIRLLKRASRFVSVRGKSTRMRPLDLGWWRWVSSALIAIYVIIGVLIPIVGLVARSFTAILSPLVSPLNFLTLENYAMIFRYEAYVDSIYNSLIIATVGAIVMSAIAVMAAMTARRSRFRFGRAFEYLCLIPQAIPGIVLGLGFFWAFAYMPFGVGSLVLGTIWALIIAVGIRAMPTAFGSIAPTIMQIGVELDHAARVSGADWVMVFFRILRRLLTPAFVGAVILGFVLILKEYSSAVFLVTADTQIFGTAMLVLWTQGGQAGAVAALAVMQIFLTAVIVAVANRLLKGLDNA